MKSISKRPPRTGAIVRVVIGAALMVVAASLAIVGPASAQPPSSGLEHTVTVDGTCPGVQTDATVPSGTTVYLCGAVTNNTDEVIDFHTWTYTAQPGGPSTPNPAFTNLRQEVAPGASITNNDFGEGVGIESFNAETVVVTSTWTARTATGADVSDSATATVTFEVPEATCRGVPATTVGTPGDDFLLVGTVGDDVIAGLGGDDLIVGNGGNDLICGHAGNDTIAGFLGADTIYGGLGHDFLTGGIGIDLGPGGPSDGRDLLIGGPGNDELDGEAGADRLLGGLGADDLDGDGGNDVLIGGPDDDKAAGAGGSDTVRGGVGNDLLLGGRGDDALGGQAGNDRMRGGPGTDGCFGGPGVDRGAGCESTVRVP